MKVKELRAELDRRQPRLQSPPSGAQKLMEARCLRDELVSLARQIVDGAEKETRALSDDEKRLSTDLDTEIAKVRGWVKAIEGEDEETRAAAAAVAPGADGPARGPVFSIEGGREVRALLPGDRLADLHPDPDPERRQASFGRMVRAMITGDWTGAEAERRAAGEGTGSLGGYMVSVPVSARLIDLARNASVLVGGGAITIPMTTAELTLVRQIQDATATWRGEHAVIPESDPLFEPIRLRATVLAAMTRVSVELMEDAQSFGGVVENSVSQALGLELDRAGIFGTGTNEPRGVFNTPGIQEVSMGANGAAFTNFDPFLDAIEEIETANGMATAAAFAPRTKRALAGLKNTQNDPMQAPADFLALQRRASNQFPITETKGTATNCSSSLVGDFAQVGIGMRTGITLEATRTGGDDTFSKLQVLIRAYLRADVAVLRPAHLSRISGIKPA